MRYKSDEQKFYRRAMKLIDAYNKDAATLEQKLHDACPLVAWKVIRMTEDEPLELDILMVHARCEVNGIPFFQSSWASRGIYRRAKWDFPGEVAYQMTRALGDAILEWRPEEV